MAGRFPDTRTVHTVGKEWSHIQTLGILTPDNVPLSSPYPDSCPPSASGLELCRDQELLLSLPCLPWLGQKEVQKVPVMVILTQ